MLYFHINLKKRYPVKLLTTMSSYSLLKNVPHIRKTESGGGKKKDTRINNTGQCFDMTSRSCVQCYSYYDDQNETAFRVSLLKM